MLGDLHVDFFPDLPARSFCRPLPCLDMPAHANDLSGPKTGFLPAKQDFLPRDGVAEQEAKGDEGCVH